MENIVINIFFLSKKGIKLLLLDQLVRHLPEHQYLALYYLLKAPYKKSE